MFNSYGAFWAIFGLPSECVACCCCSILSSCILFSIFSLFSLVWGEIPAIIHNRRGKNKGAEKSYESVKLGVCVRQRRPYDFSNNLHDSFFSFVHFKEGGIFSCIPSVSHDFFTLSKLKFHDYFCFRVDFLSMLDGESTMKKEKKYLS